MIHISIEGMDGVGKSTTCQKLANRLGYKFVEKPLHYLFDENNEIINYQRIASKVNANLNRNFTSMFYGLGSIYMYEVFKNQNIVTDRHLASNYAWSGTEYNKDVYELIVAKIGVPKLTVILYSPTDVIVKRLRCRNDKDKDILRAEKSEEIYSKMINFCTDYNFPYVVINTSQMTPDEVVERIIKEINEK